MTTSLPSSPAPQSRARVAEGLDRMFARHRLAANLLMVLMLMAGVWGALKIKVQMNPDQVWNAGVCRGRAAWPWPGASAEDMEKLVTNPVEYQLRGIEGLELLRPGPAMARPGCSCASIARRDQRGGRRRSSSASPWCATCPRIWSRPACDRPLVRDRGGGVPDRPGRFRRARPHRHEAERQLRALGADVVELRGLPRKRSPSRSTA
jgi:hypothetical protein